MRYYIAFDTKNMAPNIQATFVDIGQELIRDMEKGLAVNLCESPNYAALVAYVNANPPRKPGK